MEESVRKSWEKILNPDTLKENLIAASVFLTAYEYLRNSLISHLRGFFTDSGFMSIEDLTNPGISENYRVKVLSLDRREMVACALWFRNSGALTDEDIALIQTVTDHRNEIAHELPKLLSDTNHDVNLKHLKSVAELVGKIDNWWIREVEIPTDPDFNEAELANADFDGAYSMRMLLLSFLVQVAEGDDAGLRAVFEAWKAAVPAPTDGVG